MEKYISKSTLVAEIKKRKAINEKSYMQAFLNSNDNRDSFGYKVQEDIDILSLLDTIEVKEVDFEREFQAFAKINLEPSVTPDSNKVTYYMNQLYDCAKHFYELGLKAAMKGE